LQHRNNPEIGELVINLTTAKAPASRCPQRSSPAPTRRSS